MYDSTVRLTVRLDESEACMNRFRVQYKSHGANDPWTNQGHYGTESVALSNAERISRKYFMVRVLDPNGNVVWSH